jgi:hypothetical protein
VFGCAGVSAAGFQVAGRVFLLVLLGVVVLLLWRAVRRRS